MHHGDRARLLLQTFILGIPLWWVLGLDFIMLQGFVALLILAYPDALRRATAGDHMLIALIITLGASAFLNGFLIEAKVTRFVAALYNLSFWVCGLVLMLQVRTFCAAGPWRQLALLRCIHIVFIIVVATAWSCLVLAFAIGDMSLSTPSLFGLVAGDAIPDSAPHIQRHAVLDFTHADWGLPGVAIPRIEVFGPYPTAAAATVAVLGSLSLLYINLRYPRAWLPALVLEGVLMATIAITLTRSIIGGWVLGMLAANLLFGNTARRFGAILAAAVIGGMMTLGTVDLSQAAEYRDYSSESRFDSYLNAIQKTINKNPVMGLGIKPREESHIAVGSHSTIVTAFTKGGALSLALAVLFLFLRPAWRWFVAWMACISPPYRLAAQHRTTLRILFNLQVALWIWLCFEDIDAPATASALIFIAFAFIERATSRPTLAAASVPRPAPLAGRTAPHRPQPTGHSQGS